MGRLRLRALPKEVTRIGDYSEKTLSKQIPLPDDEQYQVVEKIAQFYSDDQILDWVAQNFQTELNYRQLYILKKHPKWQTLLQATRQKYLEAVYDIPIANRRIRVERLEHQYQALLDSHGQEGLKNSHVRREMRDIGKEARAEMADPAQVNIFATKIGSIDDEELASKISQLKQDIVELAKDQVKVKEVEEAEEVKGAQ